MTYQQDGIARAYWSMSPPREILRTLMLTPVLRSWVAHMPLNDTVKYSINVPIHMSQLIRVDVNATLNEFIEYLKVTISLI